MNVRFTSLANREFIQVFDHYAALNPATARKLAREVNEGFTLVGLFPELCRSYAPPFRRFKPRTFPYGFFYTVEPTEVMVHAVVHLHREPATIAARLRAS